MRNDSFSYDVHEVYQGKITIDQLFKSLDLVSQGCVDSFYVKDTKGKFCTAMGESPVDSADIYVAGNTGTVKVIDVICYIEPQYVHQYSTETGGTD